MKKKTGPKRKWTLYKCRSVANRYDNARDFRRYDKNCYEASKRYGYYDSITSHMYKGVNLMKRVVYVYEFEDNHAYVGITCNMKTRHERRVRDKTDSVTEYILKTKKDYSVKTLTDFIDAREAAKLEQVYIDKYKSDGWVLLNKAKAGSLGGGFKKWNKKTLKCEMLKYKSYCEFRKRNNAAYNALLRRSYRESLVVDVYGSIKASRTNSELLALAKRFSSLNEFRKSHEAEYTQIRRRGIESKCTDHMTRGVPKRPYIDIVNDVLRFKHRGDVLKSSKSLYNEAYNNGVLDDIFGKQEHRGTRLYTEDYVMTQVKKHSNILDFKNVNISTYKAASRLRMLPKIHNYYAGIIKT